MYARLQRGASVYGVDGAIEVSTFRRIPGGDEVLLSLWPTLTEAGADPASEWYEVLDDHPAGAGAPAGVAALLCFGGPMRAPVRLRGPGRTLTLWQPERLSQVTVLLGAVSAPGVLEPDRIDVYQVLSIHEGSPR